MTTDAKDAEETLSAQRLDLAARNLRHFLKIDEEEATLNGVTASLERTMINAHGNDPADLCDMMAVQTHLLDSLFHYYLDQSKTAYCKESWIDRALRAQQQTMRTALAWKRLKTETYVKHRIIQHSRFDEKTDETN